MNRSYKEKNQIHNQFHFIGEVFKKCHAAKHSFYNIFEAWNVNPFERTKYIKDSRQNCLPDSISFYFLILKTENLEVVKRRLRSMFVENSLKAYVNEIADLCCHFRMSVNIGYFYQIVNFDVYVVKVLTLK